MSLRLLGMGRKPRAPVPSGRPANRFEANLFSRRVVTMTWTPEAVHTAVDPTRSRRLSANGAGGLSSPRRRPHCDHR